PWARVLGIGGGNQRGLCWIPQIDDEVLVAFAQNDPNVAYVLGGLWSTRDRPPLSLSTDFLIKRTLKTGVAAGVGHEVEFDDALQSIKITSSTKQKITIDPLSIKIENTAGTLSVTLDNATQTISLQSALKIELKATQISLEGVTVDIKGTTINIQSAGPCSVQGLPIKLNGGEGETPLAAGAGAPTGPRGVTGGRAVPRVLTGGMPAAVRGPLHACPIPPLAGPPPPTPIVIGSVTVLIGGRPAARVGDM